MTNVIYLLERRKSKANRILDEGKDFLFETLRARIFLSYQEYFKWGAEENEQRMNLHLSLLTQKYDPMRMSGKKPEDSEVTDFLIELQESFEREINHSYFI
jgi:hypothetical protein